MNICQLSFLFLYLIQSINGGLLGEPTPVELDNPEIVRLSKVALNDLNKDKGIEDVKSELVEIVSATRQIVSGTLTKLTLRVSENEVYKTCVVKIWEQPWLNRTEITHSDCNELEERERTTRNTKMNSLLLSFKSFAKRYNKVYADEEEFNHRFRIFRDNVNEIKMLRKGEEGTAQYGLTWFADLSAKEFQRYLGLRMPEVVEQLPVAEIPDVELPDEFDWRHYNVVTPVKNQKRCGSCWAFSVTGNVEGQWAIKKNQLLSLSEQELVDCDERDNGCGGGYMTNAYEAIVDMGGLETESDYPYEAKNDRCQLKTNKIKVEIIGALNLPKSEQDIAKWLIKNGPVSAALNPSAMKFYTGGISKPPKFLCSPHILNHAVLIVGFGVHHSSFLNKTLPYWIIKNSWGKGWGEHGYYRLYKGNNSCGIKKYVTSAIVH